MVYYSAPYFYQHGNGLPAFRGGVMQKGYGLGGLFKGFMRAVAPKLKQGLVHVGKKALKTGLETLGDVASGAHVKTALKRRAKQNLGELINSGVPIKKRVTNTQIKRKKTFRGKGRAAAAAAISGKKSDIFA